MFKFTSLVLLCSVFVSSQMDDFFEGCVSPEEEEEIGQCVMVPDHWLRSMTYRYYAEVALEKGNIQPDEGNLNTLLEVTRAATQHAEAITTRIEFTTAESICNTSLAYSLQECPPLTNKANGVCQAIFRYHGYMKLEEAKCAPLA
ncbi:hypothetical protein MTO96_051726 [Rhipicephalus appendiculatus]